MTETKYGRVECYVHSDDVTENKGACIVRVQCQSEAAARTDEFKEFAKKVAHRNYAAKVVGVEVEVLFPELTWEQVMLEKALREKIAISGIEYVDLQGGGIGYGPYK